jgi:protein CpxP
MGLGGPGGPGLAFMALRRLDLTDAQKAQVKTIIESHQDEARALADRGRKARLALQTAITGETFDEATVRLKAADVAAVDADAAVAQARGFSEVYQILTSEQQARLKEMQANMQKRMEAGPRRRGPGRR